MCHFQGHGSRGTNVTKDNDRAGHMSFTVMDGSQRIFDGNFESIPADKHTVQREMDGSIFSDRDLGGVGNDLVTAGVQDLQYLRYGTSRSFLARPASHFFRD